MKMLLAGLLVVAAVFPPDSFAVDRSTTERQRFSKAHPCPVDGIQKYYNCKGYNIDHVVPLCAGGKDEAGNMQWLQIPNKHAKDAVEKASCYCVKKFGKDNCPMIAWTPVPLPAGK